jgi:hypothetical protein
MAEDTNLKLILSDLLSITTNTWDKVKDAQIKSFENSDTISGNISEAGALKLDVKLSNLFDSSDKTNALTIKNYANGQAGLYVGLPVSTDGTTYGLVKSGNGVNIANGELSVPNATNDTFGLVKAGNGVSISDGVLSVSLEGTGSADAVKNSLTIFGTAWNGSEALTIKIADDQKYLNAPKTGNVISIDTGSLESDIASITGDIRDISDSVGSNSGTSNYLAGKTIVWDGLKTLDTSLGIVSGNLNTVSGNLTSLSSKVDAIKIPAYSVSKVTTENGYAATYQLTKDGVAIGDKINIIKDQFLHDAQLIIAESDIAEYGVKAGKSYFKFIFKLNNGVNDEESEKVIYLDAADLVNVDELNQLLKVPSLDTFDGTYQHNGETITLKQNAMLFTDDGATAIYDVDERTVRKCSKEAVEEIAGQLDTSMLVTVGALTGYVSGYVKNSSISNSISSSDGDSAIPNVGAVKNYVSGYVSGYVEEEITSKIVDTIEDETDGSNLPNVEAVKNYVSSYIEETASSFGSADIKFVNSIPESYDADKNTLLFTANGETAIYDAENGVVRDISDETVAVISTSTSSSAIPTVGALTSYIEHYNDELAELRESFAALKNMITNS